MWDLIVSVPDHCLSFYFESKQHLHQNFNFCSNSFYIKILISVHNIWSPADKRDFTAFFNVLGDTQMKTLQFHVSINVSDHV